MNQLKNKTIWITGASSGIGEELALQLAPWQNRLVLSGRNIAQLTAIENRCKSFGSEVLVLPLDLEHSEDFEEKVNEVMKRFGRIDVLFNNGGISQRSLVEETPMEVERRIMEINYFGTIALTKKVLPVMVSQRTGHIVVISSMAGKFGWGQRSAYSASKHALQGYFETLGIEMESQQIKVTLVCPGRVNTPIASNAINKEGQRQGVTDKGQEKGIPVKICVSKIIKGVERGKRQILIAGAERILNVIHFFSKKLYYLIASKVNPNG